MLSEKEWPLGTSTMNYNKIVKKKLKSRGKQNGGAKLSQKEGE